VIAGQGTIGLEILRQHSRHNGPIHAVFCAIGGGGLAAGGAYIKRLRPEIKVIGVETFDADAMKQSLAAGKRVASTRSACSPTAPPSSSSARKPSACARNTSTT
jgi:threonine dehydratase